MEKLQERNKDLEMLVQRRRTAAAGEGEGPQQQFNEAFKKFQEMDRNMVEKKLSKSEITLEVLGSVDGLQKLKCELEKNEIEAVFVIDNECNILGTSTAQANQATCLVDQVVTEDNFRINDASKHLLKTLKWRKLCKELNNDEVIHVYQNNWGDIFVVGF